MTMVDGPPSGAGRTAYQTCRRVVRRLLSAFALLLVQGVLADECDPIAASLRPEPRETRFERYRDAALGDAVPCALADDIDDKRRQAILEDALTARREDIALALLKAGLRPSSLLAAADIAAHLELPLVLAALLDIDRSLGRASYRGRAPLVRAAASGSYRAAKVLLEYGADPNLGLPLVAATKAVNLHVARLLVDYGAKLAALPPDAAGELLAAAAEFSHWHFVDYLLDAGLDANLHGEEGHVLLYAGKHDAHRDRPGFSPMGSSNWNTLVSAGANPLQAVCAVDSGTLAATSAPAWFAREIDQYRARCEAVERETDADRAESNGGACSRIDAALAYEPMETRQQRLLNASAKDAIACINATSGAVGERVEALLEAAAAGRREDIAVALLAHGFRPPSLARSTVWSAGMNRPTLLGALLELDASLANAASFADVTPLESAAENGAYGAARTLLDRGADPRRGSSLHHALAGHDLDVAQLLMEATDDGQTLSAQQRGEALGSAAATANWRFVDHMLRCGFDPNARGRGGARVLLHTGRNIAFGESAWGTLVGHGADAVAAVCELDDETFAEARQGGPDWFTGRLLRYRRQCDETPRGH